MFTNLQEAEATANGWRINALIELLPLGGKMTHGFGVGYVGTTADANLVSYNISTIPIYYAPKFDFGEESIKGFVKGDFGWQISRINREGTAVRDFDRDHGFYLGLGAGVTKEINEKLSINLEYNWNYLYNGFYRDGFMNSIMAGVGYTF